MKSKLLRLWPGIGLILTITTCTVQTAPVSVPSAIASPQPTLATIVPIAKLPVPSADPVPPQPTRYLEFSDLSEAEAAATFSLRLPTFIPRDLGFYKAWISDYADGTENVRIVYAEPGNPLDANRKVFDLQMTQTDQFVSRDSITRLLKGNALDIHEVQVRGQTGFTYWTQSGAAGNSAVLIWREGTVNLRLSLFGAWPQPDEENPHGLDNVLIEIAESLLPTLSAPAVTVQVEPPLSPTATPDCQPAAGVTIEVRRLSDATVALHASGLQPGEIPFVFYSTSVGGVGASRGEAFEFSNGADEHGEFSYQLAGLLPLEGQADATWDIRLVHARGVACAQITLP